MRGLAIMAVLAVWPAVSLAGPECSAYGGETVFHCRIEDSNREVSVCDMPGGDYLYVYGRPGDPELELRRGPDEVVYTPWNGMGNAWWARLGFSNEDYFYDVGYSREKGPEDHPVYGQVEIFKGADRDRPIAIKNCRVGTVFTLLDDLWERFR